MSSNDDDLTMETNDAQESGRGDAGAPAKRSAVGGRVEHFTVEERTARGKATRAEVSRASHGDWEPAAHRPDPVELLEEQAQTRVPSSCRFATDACSSRRSPSTAAPRI